MEVEDRVLDSEEKYLPTRELMRLEHHQRFLTEDQATDEMMEIINQVKMKAIGANQPEDVRIFK